MLLVPLVLPLAGLFVVLRAIAATGAAYKAKVLASGIFVSGFDLDPDSAPEANAEAYAILRLFRARVDRSAGTVTASILGLCPRTAVHRPGRGATLALAPIAATPEPPSAARPDPAAPWPHGGAPPPAPPPALARVLDAAFAESDPARLKRTRAVLVARDGVLVAERYAPDVTAASLLNGWSMTKSVLGALIGVLVAEGKLSLDGRKLLPEWSSANDPRGAIALEDLLRMRGGQRFAEVYSNPLSDVVRMLYREPDCAAYAATKPLEAAPGTKWQYSSGTSNILSRIARNAVGEKAYADWPRRALFEPLGMTGALIETDASGTFVASSYAHATPRDWLKFGQLFLQDGVWDGKRLLPEGWVKLSASPTPQAPNGRYGAHWWLKLSKELGGEGPAAAALPADAFHALGHEGQCLTVIPSRRLVVLRMGLSIDIKAWDHAAFLAGLLETL